MLDKESVESIDNYASHQAIKFHFVPPRSPHMGGLWEAEVKPMKYHLRRVVGKATHLWSFLP
jgi:hypothetical protein